MKTFGLGIVLMTVLSLSATAQSSFDGPYGGVYVGASPTSNDVVHQAGALAGYRLSVGEVFLLGVEGQAGIGRYNGEEFAEGVILGQAGLEVGSNVALLAAVGAGLRDHNDTTGRQTSRFWSVGGGAEIAVNQIIHVRGEVHSLFVQEGFNTDEWATRANLSLIGQFD